MRALLLPLLSMVLLMTISASAEIEKTAVLCKEGICFQWWPKLAPVKGWHFELGSSNKYAINAQAPDGFTFTTAEAVIYAKASYKPRIPDTKSLEMLISNDKKEFLARVPNIVISEVDPLRTGDGKILRSFTFFPKEKGNWEQVSYGEEGDFYLIFSISSRTKEGFAKALSAYKDFISKYQEKP